MRLPDPRATATVLTAVMMLMAPCVGLAQPSGRAAVATTSHFAFYSDFATNLSLRAALAAAARTVGGSVPGDLTHPVHFFMTGEAVRRVLDRPGEPPYTSYLYALSLFSNEFRDAIKKTWPAYMDGKRTLQEAAADLIRALGR